ncbi:tryptophan-rich sensory protein [Agromyces rhizosphaerae]|uniref:Tryptophan-rich sensory protein n=1 Tax=Agromyces rhizosphaerae TaxID=88374 RepID=A0A9W6FRH7_9MICO|nr:TspO/MBR family protein [Agromyces rhizosphaerae]GLI27677.1 tryptophan-rich sensory protein [Agromyces rhizosphaerae]
MSASHETTARSTTNATANDATAPDRPTAAQATDAPEASARSTAPNDLARQLTVAVSAVLAIVGSFIGSGAAGGTPIQDAAGGALAADATPIAPGTGAFSIWSVIYAGLLAYAVWQFLPAQRSAERHRRVGYPVAASLLLNAAWILSIQFDVLWLSIPVIAVLLGVLVVAFLTLLRWRPANPLDAFLTDGTVGLYLGWVAIATAANVTAGLVAAGFDGWGIGADAWAVVVLAVAGLVGVAIAVRGGGRIAPTLSLCWGLTWVAIARLDGNLLSTPAAVAAIVAVVVVVIATILARARLMLRGEQPR